MPHSCGAANAPSEPRAAASPIVDGSVVRTGDGRTTRRARPKPVRLQRDGRLVPQKDKLAGAAGVPAIAQCAAGTAGTRLAEMSGMPGALDVVLLLTSFDVGGTERQMVELATRLDPSRFRPHLAVLPQARPSARRNAGAHPDPRVPGQGFANPAARSASSSPSRRGADRSAPTSCTPAISTANIFGLPGAALAGVPVRIANRREILTGDKSRAQLTGQRLAYRAAHAVVANSSAARDQLVREGVAGRPSSA